MRRANSDAAGLVGVGIVLLLGALLAKKLFEKKNDNQP